MRSDLECEAEKKDGNAGLHQARHIQRRLDRSVGQQLGQALVMMVRVRGIRGILRVLRGAMVEAMSQLVPCSRHPREGRFERGVGGRKGRACCRRELREGLAGVRSAVGLVIVFVIVTMGVRMRVGEAGLFQAGGRPRMDVDRPLATVFDPVMQNRAESDGARERHAKRDVGGQDLAPGLHDRIGGMRSGTEVTGR